MLVPRLTALLVDDNPHIRRAVARLLARLGFAVTAVGTCLEARNVVGPFNLGLFDIDLGDGSGVDIACDMVSARRLNRVVFFTACAHSGPLSRARRLGVVVAKGDRIASLLNAVRPCPDAHV